MGEIFVIGLLLALLLVVVSAGRGALSERAAYAGEPDRSAGKTLAWVGNVTARSESVSPRCDRLCWRKRARVAERKLRKQEPLVFVARAEFRRLYAKWLCIHKREGAWNDPNAPHYGGLQFDDSFQRSYGPEFYKRWGTADRWPPFAQLIAANRAWEVRGYTPWPNTGRACGLL